MITILMGLVLTAGAEPEPRRCQIDVRVTKPDLTAPRSEQLRDPVVGEPRIVTHFGRPAVFRFGSLREVLGVTGPGVAELVSGVELEVTALPMPLGLVHLEMRVRPAGGDPGPRVEVALKPGARCRFRGPEGTWIELTATEFAAEK